MVSLWVNSRVISPRLLSVFSAVSGFQHGYAVAESGQLFHDYETDGSRVAGMNQIALFKRPDTLSREEWLSIWLESHTKVAIDTQSTFGYRQHIVGDILTDDAPHFDAIVEENFPAAAMTSMEAFYDAVGDEEKFTQRLGEMIASVSRFIDMGSLQVLPTSEYNF